MEARYRMFKQRIEQQLESGLELSDEQLMELIETAVLEQSLEDYLPFHQRKDLIDRIYHSFRGLDILQPLIDDPTITEIMVNRHDEIFIEKQGELLLHPAKFESSERLEDIIQSIVGKINRTVNESTPIVDARLQDGSRVHIVLPPVALKGPALTIRKFPENPLSLQELVQKGALNEEAASFLQTLVICGYNLFISGGTGSGKTTLLNALAECIPKDERVITIEDSAELNIVGIPNLIRMETRNPNSEGKGSIPIRDLIRASLRMRPNRIIVGEVRGGEALDMLQAMNTGHDGSLSTGHANNVADMIGRLETMVHSAADLPIPVIRKQISSAVDIMIHLSRFQDRSRRVTEITEIVDFKQNEVILNPLYRFAKRGESPDGGIIGSLEPSGSSLKRLRKLEMSGFSERDLVSSVRR